MTNDSALETRSLESLSVPDTKLVAFYLPQYYPFKENSKWWGPGFTEWTNVAKARPNFDGHYQPHIPRDLGFYDLRLPSVMAEQAELARKYGIGAFCFYYYWFAGRRALELPLDNWLASDIDFPFCICWANENWTKRWDGGSGEILLAQNHSTEDFRNFFQAILPILRDPRYLRVNGNPILNVYRPTLFPNAKEVCDLWREQARLAGLPGLHLCTVEFYGIEDPADFGFDAAIEFPPHKFLSRENLAAQAEFTNPKFSGNVADYRKLIVQSLDREVPDYLLYRGVIPSWDNTARRQDDPFVVHHNSPALFHYWLSRMVVWTRAHRRQGQRLIYINAWNEWGEGCHLEPDLKYGTQFLEACLAALHTPAGEIELINAIVKTDGYGMEIVAPQHPFSDDLSSLIEVARKQRRHFNAQHHVIADSLINRLSLFLRKHAIWLHRPARRAYRWLRTFPQR
jgi:lipopolysaccharide biosynthesis protein